MTSDDERPDLGDLSPPSPDGDGVTGTGLRGVSRSLPMALLRTREAVMRQFRPALRSVDLTEQQWRVVRALGSVPEIDATGLAMATFLLPPSLSRILRDLERRQMITRRADRSDLRAWLISLTPQGQAIFEQAGAQAEHIYDALTERLGSARLDELMHMLRYVEQSLQTPLDVDADVPMSSSGVQPS